MVDTSNGALTVIPSNGVDTFRASTDAATLCRSIVLQTVQKIQGKRYVPCVGWQAIAVAHGCTASARGVEAIEGGVRAVGEVRRMDTGAVIAEAEGFVGDDEKMWAGRPMFARRAMAQTRAISRACRSAFAHVIVMIDKDLGTTPAEEMQGVQDHAPERPQADPQDQHLVQGDGRSTYQVAHADKNAGRLAAELWASNVLLLLNEPGYDLLTYREWKATPCTNKGTKTNEQKLIELREKHADLAQKIDDAADLLRVVA